MPQDGLVRLVDVGREAEEDDVLYRHQANRARNMQAPDKPGRCRWGSPIDQSIHLTRTACGGPKVVDSYRPWDASTIAIAKPS